MYKDCLHCRFRNATHARFCASCGRPFESPEAGGRSFWTGGWIVFALIAGGVAYLLAGNLRGGAGIISIRGAKIDRSYVLGVPKREAMFELLRPSDVRVIVSRHAEGVTIRGTAAETQALDRFVDLITRLEHLDEQAAETCIRVLRTTPTELAGYRLPKKKAHALFHILAFEDVPVLVSQGVNAIRVLAPPEDQRIVADIVDIILGERKIGRTYQRLSKGRKTMRLDSRSGVRVEIGHKDEQDAPKLTDGRQ